VKCPYKQVCPSQSGWCERDDPDFKLCVPFILMAYISKNEEVNELKKQILNLVDDGR